MNTSIFLVSLIFLGISMLVSFVLKSKFTRYNKIPLLNQLTGKEVAQKMLRESGIYDVQVLSVEGSLTDHYNPLTKTINLSQEVYNGNSIASAAIAAHECGHAVQHANSYPWLNFRSRLVPIVQVSSSLVQWVLFAGILAINVFPALLMAGIALFALITIFSIITLPVEFDASKRGLAWLKQSNIATAQEYPKAMDALSWAATTYVVAALASIATLVQYILLANRNRD